MSLKYTAHSGWVEHYSNRNPQSVTFVANKDLSDLAFRRKLKSFQLLVDEARLGKRFHLKPAETRLDFLLSPEGFDRAHPHYHGVISIPQAGRGHGPDVPMSDILDLYSSIWKQVVPSGSVKFDDLFNLAGWTSYCSKENGIANGDHTIWSLSDFVPPSA